MWPAQEKIVVAVGGNALVTADPRGSIPSQAQAAIAAMESLLPLLEAGHPLVLTHGNGFQVGNILIRVEEAQDKAYELPMEVCVAESQGEIGYLVEQALQNVLRERGIARKVVSILTQAIVDVNDPAFAHPTKPIGPYYPSEQAEVLRRNGFSLVEQPGRGWRRIVPSPRPLEIDDIEIVQWLLDKNVIVIAAGGGGIPVTRDERGRLHGVPAVIDKDLTAATLATGIGAQRLVILTGEPAVYVDYGKPTQRALRTVDRARLEALLLQGEFPAGSMGPKVEAAVRFLASGGKSALITSAGNLRAGIDLRAGTTVLPTPSLLA
jgi:carbamate kinase